MRIRELGEGDATAATALWQATGLTRPWNDPAADLLRAVRGADSVVLGVDDADGLVGTVMVGDDGHRGWMYYLAVRPDAQRSGLGRVLVAAAERWLEARGCVKAQLMVRGTNADAIGFYRALGYEDQDVVVLGRRLIEH